VGIPVARRSIGRTSARIAKTHDAMDHSFGVSRQVQGLPFRMNERPIHLQKVGHDELTKVFQYGGHGPTRCPSRPCHERLDVVVGGIRWPIDTSGFANPVSATSMGHAACPSRFDVFLELQKNDSPAWVLIYPGWVSGFSSRSNPQALSPRPPMQVTSWRARALLEDALDDAAISRLRSGREGAPPFSF